MKWDQETTEGRIAALAQASSDIVDKLTASAGLATALLQAMIEARKMQAPAPADDVGAQYAALCKLHEKVQQELEVAQKDRDEARADRDTAEKYVARLQAEKRQLQKLGRECKGAAPRKRRKAS